MNNRSQGWRMHVSQDPFEVPRILGTLYKLILMLARVKFHTDLRWDLRFQVPLKVFPGRSQTCTCQRLAEASQGNTF